MPTPLEHYQRAEDLLAQAEELVDTGALANEYGTSAKRHLDHLTRAAQAEAMLAAVPWARDEAVDVAHGLDSDEVAALLTVVRELAAWLDEPATAVPIPDDVTDLEAYVAGYTAVRQAVTALIAPTREALDL